MTKKYLLVAISVRLTYIQMRSNSTTVNSYGTLAQDLHGLATLQKENLVGSFRKFIMLLNHRQPNQGMLIVYDKMDWPDIEDITIPLPRPFGR